MSDAADSMRGYWCEVIAEGPVYGKDEWVRVSLGTFQTPFVGRALRWLRRQALRVADGLDPAPDAASSLCASLRPVECATIAQLGDVPTDLRNWADGDWSRQVAYDQLCGGEQFVLAAADHTGRYVLAAWPVDVPALPDALPVQDRQSQNSRSHHLKHRKHRGKTGWLLLW
ncbi:hypothetical protein LKL35_12160 [Streptomyces sp. ET3-23]|uniref:hypothetical protein n=1 Tax=Streptomyces sp. ET3-23 TaxID=2885643 RepID=UPI001D12609C|nr:hypothetical protein [Streptomyces sp. ET3-23]MCC2276163.1 hypothetical protein [Streptomyces sp. ET3-23]